MRAVGITRFGGPEVLELVEKPVPVPGEGEVRIRVAAATVNPTDTVLRAGARGIPEQEPPYVPGMELAGTVDAVGPDKVSIAGREGARGAERGRARGNAIGAGAMWRPGDRVMAIVSPRGPRGGAQAEYVVVPAGSVARMPEGASFAEAATLPMNGLTARLALDQLALPAGETIAVTGAAGAVGGYTTQLAAGEGLRVIGDAKPGDEELVLALGAGTVVPRGPDVATAIREHVPDGVAAVVDAALIGPPVQAAIADGGQLIAVRPFRGEPERGITVKPILVTSYLREGAKLASLADLAAKGSLTLRVARQVPAAQAADAHRLLEGGGIRGRLVLMF